MKVEGHEFEKEPSMLEVKAYRDTWSRGLDSYLEWFYGMANDLYQLLKLSGVPVAAIASPGAGTR